MGYGIQGREKRREVTIRVRGQNLMRGREYIQTLVSFEKRQWIFIIRDKKIVFLRDGEEN